MELRKCSQIPFLLEKDEAVVCCTDRSNYSLLLRTSIFLEISPGFLTVSNDNALCLLLPVPSAGCWVGETGGLSMKFLEAGNTVAYVPDFPP